MKPWKSSRVSSRSLKLLLHLSIIMKTYLLDVAWVANCIVLQANQIDFAIALPWSWLGDSAFHERTNNSNSETARNVLTSLPRTFSKKNPLLLAVTFPVRNWSGCRTEHCRPSLNTVKRNLWSDFELSFAKHFLNVNNFLRFLSVWQQS